MQNPNMLGKSERDPNIDYFWPWENLIFKSRRKLRILERAKGFEPS
jgi:hypothetical protein